MVSVARFKMTSVPSERIWRTSGAAVTVNGMFHASVLLCSAVVIVVLLVSRMVVPCSREREIVNGRVAVPVGETSAVKAA